MAARLRIPLRRAAGGIPPSEGRPGQRVITAALANQIEIGVIQVEEARELFR